MELLSARLGDVLSHLYMASASVWRYQVEGHPDMLPLARAAIQDQLALACAALRDLYANLPSKVLRLAAPLILRGTGHLAPLRDRDRLTLADSLRESPALLARLCPDVMNPALGGLHDLIEALTLADAVGDEIGDLNTALRRAESLPQVAAQSKNPAAALAYLQAADRVIQVDDFPPEKVRSS